MSSEFSTLSVKDKTSVMDIILNPVETSAVVIRPQEKSETYLEKCERNLRSELWGLYSSKVRPAFPAWRDALMDRVYFQTRVVWSDERDHPTHLVVGVFQDIAQRKAKDLKELRWNLVVWGSELHLLLPAGKKNGAGANEDDILMFRAGCRVNDRYNSGGDDFFHVVGYVQPYYAELSAIKEFQLKLKGGKGDDMISMLANPCTRGEFLFNMGCMKFSNEVVPINELQSTIIGGLSKKIECIQGPPGTGKSTTIFHIVQSAIPTGYHAIVTCIQNKALDSIAEKLGPTGLPFVVYGNPTRLGDWAKRFTLAAQVERHPEVVEIKNQMRKLEGKRELVLDSMKEIELKWVEVTNYNQRWIRLWRACVTQGKHDGYLALQEDLACNDREFCSLQADLVDIRARIKTELRESSRASLSTLDGLAGADILPRPSIVIIDEAGTVPEYKMPLLVTMKAEAIVAIGDQNQLQPFSHASKDGEALDGFFTRVVKALGEANVPMLKEQYRMHPVNCELVSNCFYGGQLITGKRVEVARLNVVGGGITWRNYSDVDAESSGKLKKWNPVEVDMIGTFMCDELPALLRQGKSVSIITFYKQQYVELMKLGEDMRIVRTPEEVKNAPPGAGRFKDPNFRIVTVDAAQGSEADVVVLSCVRCNRQRKLGFITDKNRLCVALSRAREMLIVVGSMTTLRGDPVWREVIKCASS